MLAYEPVLSDASSGYISGAPTIHHDNGVFNVEQRHRQLWGGHRTSTDFGVMQPDWRTPDR